MPSLSSPVSTAAAAEQSGWAEVYDFYLRAPISTPLGTLSTLRLTSYPGGISFFTPTTAPEPAGTRSTSQAYTFWPLTRGTGKSATAHTDDQFTLAASNVTGEWAGMLTAIDWRGTPVVVRLVPTTTAGTLTAADSVTIFSGLIDTVAELTLQAIQFTCSNGLGNFQASLPKWGFHPSCNFRFGDDRCGALPWSTENYQTGTVGSSSTTTVVNSANFTSDSGTAGTYGTDRVDALANAKITTSTADTGLDGFYVKATYSPGHWSMTPVSSQWGTNTQGYWTLGTAQAGAENPLLEPYITFDFTSAIALKLWQISGVPGYGREVLPKMVSIFSSDDLSTWVFERHAQLPPVGGQLYDILVPKAHSRRYWRICLRSRYAGGFYQPVFEQVSAFTDSRNWWRDGTITFDPTTATVALRNARARIRESYSGQVILTRALPAAPAAGDTFTLARGCARDWNACCERGRYPYFGGFPDIGAELVANTSGRNQTAPASGGTTGRTHYVP